MARIGESGDLLKCSFCGKSQKQVKKLIAGPGVYICDECIDLCNEIIEEEFSEGAESWDAGRAAKPHQIRQFLDSYVIGQSNAKKAWPLRSTTITSASRPKPPIPPAGPTTKASSWRNPTSC